MAICMQHAQVRDRNSSWYRNATAAEDRHGSACQLEAGNAVPCVMACAHSQAIGCYSAGSRVLARASPDMMALSEADTMSASMPTPKRLRVSLTRSSR